MAAVLSMSISPRPPHHQRPFARRPQVQDLGLVLVTIRRLVTAKEAMDNQNVLMLNIEPFAGKHEWYDFLAPLTKDITTPTKMPTTHRLRTATVCWMSYIISVEYQLHVHPQNSISAYISELNKTIKINILIQEDQQVLVFTQV